MTERKNCFAKKILTGLLLMTGFLGILKSQPALADDTPRSEITMSPAKSVIELEAGQSFDGSFKIYNNGNVDFEFSVYASPYSIDEDSCGQNFTIKTDRTQLSDWVKFAQDKYNLKAGENITVNYSVTVPNDIPDGGQYAVLFAETAGAQGGSISSRTRVGMLLHAHTNGETILEGEADKVEISKIKFNDQLSINQTIKNTGNTDFPVDATLEVKNIFGATIHSDEIRDSRILPKTTCGVQIIWKNAPIFGLFNIKMTTRFLDKTSENSGWTLFISPIVIGVLALVVLAIILWKHYGKTKRHYR